MIGSWEAKKNPRDFNGCGLPRAIAHKLIYSISVVFRFPFELGKEAIEGGGECLKKLCEGAIKKIKI